jgi:hypothetical protein
MKKSTSVTVTAVAAISVAIACSPSNGRQSRVCVDSSSRVVSADRCENSGRYAGSHFWYYHAGYARLPYPAAGTMVRPGGTTIATTPAPAVRGGFGSTGSGRAVSA